MNLPINSRILLSVASIATAGALVVGGTFAFFSDNETSNDNTFGAGTVDLVLCDNAAEQDDPGAQCPNEEGPEDSVLASFTASNLVPGASPTPAGFIELKNTGSLPIAEVELSGIASATVENGNGGSIPTVLNLTVKSGSDSSCTAGTDLTPTLATFFGNNFSPLTLAELGNGSVFDALAGIAPSSSYFLCMDVALDSSAGDLVQGDQAEIDLTFKANQDASQ